MTTIISDDTNWEKGVSEEDLAVFWADDKLVLAVRQSYQLLLSPAAEDHLWKTLKLNRKARKAERQREAFSSSNFLQEAVKIDRALDQTAPFDLLNGFNPSHYPGGVAPG